MTPKPHTLVYSEDCSAAVSVRAFSFLGDQIFDRRTPRAALQELCLFVQPLDSSKLFIPPELRFLNGGFQDANGLVVDAKRDGEGVSILATVRQREARRVSETVRRAVDDLCNQSQSANCSRAYAGREQELDKVDRTSIGCRSQVPMKAPQRYVTRTYIMMLR